MSFRGISSGSSRCSRLRKLRPAGEIIELMPKQVTIHDPWINLRADMSRDDISETQIHPHFTNIQHALRLARQNLASVDTPNKQIILITDGLPTAHFEDSMLYLMYPPNPRTEQATMREGALCQRDGITINIFLVPSWSQSEEDIKFAYRSSGTNEGKSVLYSRQGLGPLRGLGLHRSKARSARLVARATSNRAAERCHHGKARCKRKTG